MIISVRQRDGWAAFSRRLSFGLDDFELLAAGSDFSGDKSSDV
jgi:hypothetical protein